MRVVYVTASVGQKSENVNIWTINLNNYRTLRMRVINNVKKFQNVWDFCPTLAVTYTTKGKKNSNVCIVVWC